MHIARSVSAAQTDCSHVTVRRTATDFLLREGITSVAVEIGSVEMIICPCSRQSEGAGTEQKVFENGKQEKESKETRMERSKILKQRVST